MDDKFDNIVDGADWKGIMPRLLSYADVLIRRCFWRGMRVSYEPGAKCSLDGFGADDFVQEAIDRLLNGRRDYNFTVTLEQNLRGVVRSIIWSSNKSANRRPLAQPVEKSDADGGENDPLNRAADPSPAPDESLGNVEAAGAQKRLLADFERSISHDLELSSLVEAFKDECYLPRKIETLTGIPANRVSELRRKLGRKLEKFVEKHSTAQPCDVAKEL